MKASTGCWANVEPNWFIILDNNIVKEYVVIAIQCTTDEVFKWQTLNIKWSEINAIHEPTRNPNLKTAFTLHEKEKISAAEAYDKITATKYPWELWNGEYWNCVSSVMSIIYEIVMTDSSITKIKSPAGKVFTIVRQGNNSTGQSNGL